MFKFIIFVFICHLLAQVKIEEYEIIEDDEDEEPRKSDNAKKSAELRALEAKAERLEQEVLNDLTNNELFDEWQAVQNQIEEYNEK